MAIGAPPLVNGFPSFIFDPKMDGIYVLNGVSVCFHGVESILFVLIFFSMAVHPRACAVLCFVDGLAVPVVNKNVFLQFFDVFKEKRTKSRPYKHQ